MPTNPAQPVLQPDTPVIQWLLAGDPAIRWQVMAHLLDAPAEQVTAERARVATEGAGAWLLALRVLKWYHRRKLPGDVQH